MKKYLKLLNDTRGFTWHHLMPVLVVAIIAVAGVRVIEGSHAAAPIKPIWTYEASLCGGTAPNNGCYYIFMCRSNPYIAFGKDYNVTALFEKPASWVVTFYEIDDNRPVNGIYTKYSYANSLKTGPVFWSNTSAELTIVADSSVNDRVHAGLTGLGDTYVDTVLYINPVGLAVCSTVNKVST